MNLYTVDANKVTFIFGGNRIFAKNTSCGENVRAARQGGERDERSAGFQMKWLRHFI